MYIVIYCSISVVSSLVLPYKVVPLLFSWSLME